MTDQIITSKIIKTLDVGGATDLLCPRCGADLLHHGPVTVYDRTEDAERVTETRVNGPMVAINAASSGTGNPSRRRDGITIDFECEGCGDSLIQLCIGQHKGSTEIGWRYVQSAA